MPRQRTQYNRITCVFPDDIDCRLERFKEESGLTWAELSRRLGTYPLAMRRWRRAGVQPNLRHMMALLDLADGLGLGHLLTAQSCHRENGNEMSTLTARISVMPDS